MGIYLGDKPLALSTTIDIVQDLEIGNLSADKVTSSQCVKNAIDEVQGIIDDIAPHPTGGTTGQVLSKASDATHDTTWKNAVLPVNETAKLKVWTGNKAQYTALATRDSNTLYNVTGDAVSAKAAPSSAKYIGEFRDIYLQTPPIGWAVRNGSLITRASVSYPTLIEFLKDNAWITKTEEEWQALSAAAPFEGIGGAPFFVLDEVANTIRLPDTRGMYSAGSFWNCTVDVGAVGDVVGDAIRNIEGALSSRDDYAFSVLWRSCIPSGAFELATKSLRIAHTNANNPGQIGNVEFDASKVVPTASRNQPATYYTLPCVYIGRSLI